MTYPYPTVKALHPAEGWLAVFFTDEEDPGYETHPLLFWGVVEYSDGETRIEGFMEPTLGDPAVGPAEEASNFLCYARQGDLEVGSFRYRAAAKQKAEYQAEMIAKGDRLRAAS